MVIRYELVAQLDPDAVRPRWQVDVLRINTTTLESTLIDMFEEVTLTDCLAAAGEMIYYDQSERLRLQPG